MKVCLATIYYYAGFIAILYRRTLMPLVLFHKPAQELLVAPSFELNRIKM